MPVLSVGLPAAPDLPVSPTHALVHLDNCQQVWASVLLELHLKGVTSVMEVSLKEKTCHQEALHLFLSRCLIH